LTWLDARREVEAVTTKIDYDAAAAGGSSFEGFKDGSHWA